MSGQGISYPPPSENLPIFDASVFNVNDTPLTISEGLKYFLAYPSAQGTENLQTINVGGLATFSNNLVLNGNVNITNTNNNGFINFPSSSIFSTNTGTLNGLGVYLNYQGNGETDLIGYGGTGQGGISLYTSSNTLAPSLVANFSYNTITLGNTNYNISITGNNGDVILSNGGVSSQDFVITANNQNLNLDGGYINFLADVLLTSYISQPSLSFSGSIQNTIQSGYGSFFHTNGVPYFTYNNGSTTPTASQLLTSSSLSNYALLTTGTNSFTNVNTFSQTPTTTASQTYPQTTNTTQFSTIGYVNSAIGITTTITTNNCGIISNIVGWTFNLPNIGQYLTFKCYTNNIGATTTYSTGATITNNGTSIFATGSVVLQNINIGGLTTAYAFGSILSNGATFSIAQTAGGTSCSAIATYAAGSYPLTYFAAAPCTMTIIFTKVY